MRKILLGLCAIEKFAEFSDIVRIHILRERGMKIIRADNGKKSKNSNVDTI